MPPPEPSTGITEPVDRRLHRHLRRAVLDHATSERRRRTHPAVLHVGVPGVVETVLAVRADEHADHGLRIDLVSAMLRRCLGARSGAQPAGGEVPLVWLTRPGDLALQDEDVAWLAATITAYAEWSLPLCLVVVNRHGWRDPRTGVSRTWRRLRAPG